MRKLPPAKPKATPAAIARNTSTLVCLLAARKIIDAELDGAPPLPVGEHQVADMQLTVDIAGAAVGQAAATTRPKYSTFPMDLAVGFLLRRLPAGERSQIRAEMFSLFDALERGDESAIAQREELETAVEQIKQFKRKIGDTDVKGAQKVTAIGAARVEKAA